MIEYGIAALTNGFGINEMNFQEQLDAILKKYKPANYGIVIKSQPNLYQWLKDQIKYQTDSISELLFLYQNPQFNPICERGNKRKYQNGKYSLGCGGQCECVLEYNKQIQTQKHKERNEEQKTKIREKIKNALLKRYGSETTFGSESIKQKIKNKNIEKYGVEVPSKTLEIRNKIKEQIVTRSDEYKKQIKKKFTNTVLEKYGVYHPLQSLIVKNKVKTTFLEKYGVDHNWKNKEIYEKSRQTCVDRYGEKFTQKLKEFSDKIVSSRQNSMFKKYGVISNSHFHLTQEQIDCLYDKEKFINVIKDKTYAEISLKYGFDRETIGRRAEEFGVLDLIKQNQYESSLELRLEEILKEYNIEYFKNDRKTINPLELDLVLPKSKIAFECNGLYWHSEVGGKKSHLYHFDKWRLCKEKGIDLYQFFEDEIYDCFEIIKSKILYLNNKHHGKIFGARCLTVNWLKNYRDEIVFYKNNHIQGPMLNRTHVIGAWNDQFDLVAAMSVKQSEHKNQIEIVRFATDINNRYPGVFSKMLNWFIGQTNFKGEALSWSDNRHSNGNLYRSNGFIPIKTQQPSYFITDYQHRWRREHFMKNKIKQRYPDVDLNKTEWQLEQELGHDRIWDAGKILWQKTV